MDVCILSCLLHITHFQKFCCSQLPMCWANFAIHNLKGNNFQSKKDQNLISHNGARLAFWCGCVKFVTHKLLFVSLNMVCFFDYTQIPHLGNYYTPRLATRVDPNTLQGKFLPVPLKSRDVLCHKNRQDRNSGFHPTRMQAFVYDGSVINNLVCVFALTSES